MKAMLPCLKLNQLHHFRLGCISQFCTINSKGESSSSKSYKDIIANLEKSQVPVKVFESLYSFKYEKLFVHASIIFSFISGSVIFGTNIMLIFKFLNLILFVPSVLAVVDRLIGHSFFVTKLTLISTTEVEFVNCYKKKLKAKIEDIVPLEANNEITSKEKFNHELFRIITIKNRSNFFYLPRSNSVLCEPLFEDILNGNKLI